MVEKKYSKYICTELRSNIQLPVFRAKENLTATNPGERRRMNHVIWMDSEVIPGAFYSECAWFFPGELPEPRRMNNGGGPKPHKHPFSECVTFFGTNWDDPTDLGREVEF